MYGEMTMSHFLCNTGVLNYKIFDSRDLINLLLYQHTLYKQCTGSLIIWAKTHLILQRQQEGNLKMAAVFKHVAIALAFLSLFVCSCESSQAIYRQMGVTCEENGKIYSHMDAMPSEESCVVCHCGKVSAQERCC